MVVLESVILPMVLLVVMMVMIVLLVTFVLQMDAEELLLFVHLLLLNVKKPSVLLDNVYYVTMIVYNATLKILHVLLPSVSMVNVPPIQKDTLTVPILISVPLTIPVVLMDVPLLDTLVSYLHVSTLTVTMMVGVYMIEM